MQKLLIVGCGDVARRTLPHLLGRYRLFALLRDPARRDFWRANGVRTLLASLDQSASLMRIAGLPDIVLHFAPPPETGVVDTRMCKLLATLALGKSLPQRIIYVSTSGVYGDCDGARISEAQPLRPTTARAKRRVDAERRLLRFGRAHGICVCILRAPGIYAADRLPLERIRKGMPALCAEEDVYTNHIHADDLAALVCAALRHGRPGHVYNASDDSALKMGDYFDLVADRFGLPRPPRITRAEAVTQMSPLQLSFMSESRRLDNRRIKTELRARLRYPTVADGVEAAWQMAQNEKR